VRLLTDTGFAVFNFWKKSVIAMNTTIIIPKVIDATPHHGMAFISSINLGAKPQTAVPK
jgi:hypothetical protein